MKITDFEISENCVKSAPDSLKAEGDISPRDIKHIFDKLPELIAAKFNAFADYVLENIYSKAETDAAISQRVVEIGGGDMAKAVYDKDNDGFVDVATHAMFLNGLDSRAFARAEELVAVSDTAASAKTTATAAQTSANQAKATADTAQSAANAAMPKSGGEFSGRVWVSPNLDAQNGYILRNSGVVDSTGLNFCATKYIILQRKGES
ncbi:MAG: hypothetical protein IJN69_01375 [Oscillospiraceae bacterium]|nr:hypothetical protein [Oscillospiraceae bacterium]